MAYKLNRDHWTYNLKDDEPFDLEIVNYERYNSKKYLGKGYFTMLNTLPHSRKIRALKENLYARWLYVVLLCEASHEASPKLTVTLQQLRHVGGSFRTSLREAIFFLEQVQLVTRDFCVVSKRVSKKEVTPSSTPLKILEESDTNDGYRDSVKKALGTKDSPEKEVRPLVKKFLCMFNEKPSESLIDRNIDKMVHFLKKNSISKEEMDEALDNRLDTLFDENATVHYKQPHCSLDSFLKGYDRYSPHNYKRENQWKHENVAVQEDKKYADIVNNLFAEEDKKKGVSK